MAAVLGLEPEKIEQICQEVTEQMGGKQSADGIPMLVSVANYNCPGQIVITGESSCVAAAGEKCKEAGAKRVLPLKVSGPFHSSLLEGAGQKLAETLKDVELQQIQVPYLTNVTADYVADTTQICSLLEKQVSSSVRWQQTIERLIADGADEFVEIGPGRTLSGFVKKIDRTIHTVQIDKMEDFLNYVNR